MQRVRLFGCHELTSDAETGKDRAHGRDHQRDCCEEGGAKGPRVGTRLR